MAKTNKNNNTSKSSNEETIGFHKGSLSTLAKERAELLKMVSITEQLMKMHISGLEELGVDLSKITNQGKKEKSKENNKTDAKIEDLI